MKFLLYRTSPPEEVLYAPDRSIVYFDFDTNGEKIMVFTGDTKSEEENKDINDLVNAINDNVAKIQYSNLVISAPNVYYWNTNTTITYTYHKDYVNSDGDVIKYNEIKGTATSDTFDENDSYTEYKTRTISFSIEGLSESIDIIQGVKNDVDFGDNIPVGNYNNLIITADNVTANKTNTTIHYSIGYNYVTAVNSAIQENATYSGTATSDSFDKNTDEENTVTITINYAINTLSASTTITQGVYIPSDLLEGENEIDNSDTTMTQKTWSNRTGRLYSFIAPETATYKFSFNDNVTGGTASDTYGYLLNEACDTQLTYNDDDAGNSDPLMSYSCTAGTKYYVLLTPYSTGSTANVKGTLTISKS